jgi:hypothetical protein
LDPKDDGAAFSAPGYAVHRHTPVPAQLPEKRAQDALFKAAGLSDPIQDWDAAERDVLYLRAKALSAKELAKRYPTLDPAALKKLHEAVAER